MVLGLYRKSPASWLEAVLADFDRFLLDHAACERKASASCMQMVTHYRDKPDIIEPMIEMAQEELAHFAAVYQHIKARGLALGNDEKDPYLGALLKHLRQGNETFLLDRLLLMGIVEARGCERFAMIADALPESDPLRSFYQDITRSESRHHGLCIRLARNHYSDDVVTARQSELLQVEEDILQRLEIRARLH